MNSKEFVNLEEGDVVRYKGKSKKILSQLSKKLQKEGVVVSYIHDTRGISYYPKRDRTLDLVYKPGYRISNVQPRDWERNPTKQQVLENARHKRKSKKERIENRKRFERMKEEFGQELDDVFDEALGAMGIEYMNDRLNKLDVGQKFAVLATLNKRQRRLYHFLSRDEETLKEEFRKWINSFTKDID